MGIFIVFEKGRCVMWCAGTRLLPMIGRRRFVRLMILDPLSVFVVRRVTCGLLVSVDCIVVLFDYDFIVDL